MVDVLWQGVKCAAGDCTFEPQVEREGSPDDRTRDVLPCTKASTETLSASSTDFLFKRWTSGSRYLVTERSDGAVEILDTESKGSGAVVAGGAKIGKSNGKLGADGKATQVKVEEKGDLYVLETPAERKRFEKAKTDYAVDVYMKPLADLDDPGVHERNYEKKMAPFLDGSYQRVSEGGSVDVSGGIKILRGGAGVSGETGTIVEENHRTGETTVSYDVKASGTGELGALFVGDVSSGGDGLVAVSLTTDSNGTPKRIVLTSEAEGRVGADVTLDPTRVVDLPSLLRNAAGISAGKSKGAVLRVTAALELDDPDEQAAALRFAEDPGIDAGRDLLEQFDASGSGLVEVLRSNTTRDGFGAGVALLGALGLEKEDSVRSLTIEKAWGWDPAQGMTQRSDCTP